MMKFFCFDIDTECYIDNYTIRQNRQHFKEKVCSNFTEYFKINFHNIRSRNKDFLLNIPKVKLELEKSGFFFMGAKL